MWAINGVRKVPKTKSKTRVSAEVITENGEEEKENKTLQQKKRFRPSPKNLLPVPIFYSDAMLGWGKNENSREKHMGKHKGEHKGSSRG